MASTDRPDSRWWLPIAGLVVAFVTIAIAMWLLPPDPFSQLILVPALGVGFALQLLSPLFVHRDRQYLRTVSSWDPSGWYYLMVLPPLTLVLAPLYLYYRHRAVDVP